MDSYLRKVMNQTLLDWLFVVLVGRHNSWLVGCHWICPRLLSSFAYIRGTYVKKMIPTTCKHGSFIDAPSLPCSLHFISCSFCTHTVNPSLRLCITITFFSIDHRTEDTKFVGRRESHLELVHASGI